MRCRAWRWFASSIEWLAAADYDQAAVGGIGEAFEDGAALRRGGLFVPLADHDQGWRGDFRR